VVAPFPLELILRSEALVPGPVFETKQPQTDDVAPETQYALSFAILIA
jgi:hypothetical protein